MLFSATFVFADTSPLDEEGMKTQFSVLEKEYSATTNIDEKLKIAHAMFELADSPDFNFAMQMRDSINLISKTFELLQSRNSKFNIFDVVSVLGIPKEKYSIIDIDKDGEVEIYFGKYFGTGILLYTNSDGAAKIKTFETVYTSEISQYPKIENYDMAFIATAGGSGAGVGYVYLIKKSTSDVQTIFRTPDCSTDISFADHWKTGKIDAIICNETIEYKTLYLPRIYRFSEDGIHDATLSAPEILINAYSALNKEQQEQADSVIRDRSAAYADFWDKKLRPIKK
jgi:hypothetical protein